MTGNEMKKKFRLSLFIMIQKKNNMNVSTTTTTKTNSWFPMDLTHTHTHTHKHGCCFFLMFSHYSNKLLWPKRCFHDVNVWKCQKLSTAWNFSEYTEYIYSVGQPFFFSFSFMYRNLVVCRSKQKEKKSIGWILYYQFDYKTDRFILFFRIVFHTHKQEIIKFGTFSYFFRCNLIIKKKYHLFDEKKMK